MNIIIKYVTQYYIINDYNVEKLVKISVQDSFIYFQIFLHSYIFAGKLNPPGENNINKNNVMNTFPV